MNKRELEALSKATMDVRFEPGGLFETECIDGRLQTRLFAEAFCKHTRLQLQSGQTMLDSSCALGDALPVFHKHFPGVRLYGSDISSKAIERCQKEQFRNLASFFTASIEHISDTYDVIYSSNTIEHFPDYRDKARALLQHCRYLCILAPYNEKRFGRDLELEYDPSCPHVHVVTIREHSFDFLLDEGLAKKIYPPKVLAVPKAWSPTLQTRIKQSFKNVLRLLLKRPLWQNKRQILFEIERSE